jgi:hypothetical protein
MTLAAVVLDKMTEAQLSAGTYQPALLAWWHAALVACDAFAEGGEFGHLSPVQSLLEVAAAASLSADAARTVADDAALAIDATTPFTASTSFAACGGGVTVFPYRRGCSSSWRSGLWWRCRERLAASL